MLGLPGLLLANRKRAAVRSNAPPLKLYGPRDMAAVCQAATAMLQADRLPSRIPEHEVHYVAPGDSVSIGDITVNVGRAFHPVDARCYRFEDSASGATAVITGDTATTRVCRPSPRDATFSSMMLQRVVTRPRKICK